MTEGNTDVVTKLADFGLACYMDPASKGHCDFCGTDIFMAPEMLKLWANPSKLPNVYKSQLNTYN